MLLYSHIDKPKSHYSTSHTPPFFYHTQRGLRHFRIGFIFPDPVTTSIFLIQSMVKNHFHDHYTKQAADLVWINWDEKCVAMPNLQYEFLLRPVLGEMQRGHKGQQGLSLWVHECAAKWVDHRGQRKSEGRNWICEYIICKECENV